MKKLITLLALILIAFASTVKAQDAKPSVSWQELYSGRDMMNMYCMFFKDANNGWVAGAHNILHTSDGGKTWENQFDGEGRILAIYFKNDKDGFAAGESNLYIVTHDGGKTWKANYSMFQSAKFTKIFFTDQMHGYMLSDGGVYRSSDGGTTWKDMGPKKPNEQSTEDFTGLSFTDSKHGILVGGGEMMFTTSDGGTTWTRNTKDYFSGPRRNYYSIGFINATTGWIACSKASDEDKDIDCLYTNDGGTTWTTKKCFNLYQVNNFTFHGNCGVATYQMNRTTIMVTTDGGATWTEQGVVSNQFDKVFGAEVFSPTSGFAGVTDDANDLFHIYVPKQ